jgi:hypothetical protein
MAFGNKPVLGGLFRATMPETGWATTRKSGFTGDKNIGKKTQGIRKGQFRFIILMRHNSSRVRWQFPAEYADL